jgi:MSHA biogenesis protein MshN
MGVFQMSLINKMLQDLDARRSEVTGTGGLGSHVRVVAKRHRSHAAWWVAGVLAVILAGVIAWLLLSPAHVADMRAPSPTLPVKSASAPGTPQANKNEASRPDAAPLMPSPAQNPPVQKEEKALAPSTQIIPDPSKEVEPGKQAKQQPEPATPSSGTVSSADSYVPPPLPIAPRKPKTVEPIVPPGLNKTLPASSSPQQRADSEYRKALSLREQGKSSEAIASLEQALQFDPQLVAARQVLIGMLIENNRQDEALKRAQEGLDIDPAQAGLAMISSRLQLEKGWLKPAIETLEHSLRYALDRADYQAYLAALLQRDGRHKDAVDHYLVAVRQQPQNGVWWMGMGISLQAENRLPEAREAFNRAKDSNTLSADLLVFVDSKLKQLPR